MNNNYSYISLIVLIPAAIGTGLDKFLIDHDKGRLHDFLLRAWIVLDETTVPNLPKLISSKIITAFQKMFGTNFFSFKAIVSTFMISTILTILALHIGNYILYRHLTLERFDYIILIAIIINYPFDFITTFITYKAMHVINSSSLIYKCLAAIGDIIIALFLALFVCFVFCALDDYEYNFRNNFWEYYPPISSSFYQAINIFKLNDRYKRGGEVVFLVSSTTLIPSICFMLLIFLSILSKFLLIISKWFTMYYLERSTQVDSSNELIVFTLTGWLCSMLCFILLIFYVFIEKLKTIQ